MENNDFVNNLQQMWRKMKRSEILETDCKKVWYFVQKGYFRNLDSKKMRCENVKN